LCFGTAIVLCPILTHLSYVWVPHPHSKNPEHPRGLALLNFYFWQSYQALSCYVIGQTNPAALGTTVYRRPVYLHPSYFGIPHTPTKKPNESKKTYSYPILSFRRAARPVRAALARVQSILQLLLVFCNSSSKISSIPLFPGYPLPPPRSVISPRRLIAFSNSCVTALPYFLYQLWQWSKSNPAVPAGAQELQCSLNQLSPTPNNFGHSTPSP
jgi:hypothetical protein